VFVVKGGGHAPPKRKGAVAKKPGGRACLWPWGEGGEEKKKGSCMPKGEGGGGGEGLKNMVTSGGGKSRNWGGEDLKVLRELTENVTDKKKEK